MSLLKYGINDTKFVGPEVCNGRVGVVTSPQNSLLLCCIAGSVAAIVYSSEEK
jgi:hypothetical protein